MTFCRFSSVTIFWPFDLENKDLDQMKEHVPPQAHVAEGATWGGATWKAQSGSLWTSVSEAWWYVRILIESHIIKGCGQTSRSLILSLKDNVEKVGDSQVREKSLKD
ncbi:hypothetical protein L484_010175 [Morus notabilis]|uniref:Uncharacterized protein n=1 Tax=Morus notabilis TaxID=981085 RepID=W9RHL3_9ROSA|nr:hypothetical protein L484_010175 [Morus notabilis]